MAGRGAIEIIGEKIDVTECSHWIDAPKDDPDPNRRAWSSLHGCCDISLDPFPHYNRCSFGARWCRPDIRQHSTE